MLNLERIKKAIASNELSTLDLSRGTVRDSKAHSLHEPTTENWIAHPSPIKGVKALKDGSLLSWSDKQIKLWDAKEKKCIASFTLPLAFSIRAVESLASGEFAAVAAGSELKIQFLDKSLKPISTLNSEERGTPFILANGNIAINSSEQVKMIGRLGNLIASFKREATITGGSGSSCFNLNLLGVDKLILSDCAISSNSISCNSKLIDQTGAVIAKLSMSTYSGYQSSASFQPVSNGTAVIRSQSFLNPATNATKYELSMLDTRGNVTANIMPTLDGSQMSFHSSHPVNDKTVLIVSYSINYSRQYNEARLVDEKGIECAAAIKLPFNISKSHCFATEDGNVWVANLVNSQCIMLTDFETNKNHLLRGHFGTVVEVKSLPNDLLASMDNTGTLKIWDVNSKECVATLTGAVVPNGMWEVIAEGIVLTGNEMLSFLDYQDIVGSKALDTSEVLDVLKALASNSSVTSIHLHDLPIGDKVAQALANLLSASDKIQVIDLHNTRISDVGAQPLLSAIKANPHAVMIDLSGSLVSTAIQNRFAAERARKTRLNAPTADRTPVLALPPIPPEFRCPLTKKVMSEPVIIGDGISYEKEAIVNWLKTHNTAPSGEVLDSKSHLPNRLLQNQIKSFVETHPEIIESDEYYFSTEAEQAWQKALADQDIAKINQLATQNQRLLSLSSNAKTALLKRAIGNSLPVLKTVVGLLGPRLAEHLKLDSEANWFKSAARLGDEAAKYMANLLQWNIADYEAMLFAAVREGDSSLLEICLDLGASLDSLDKEGNTPLHHAILHKRKAMVDYLLHLGMNADISNLAGQKPNEFARTLGDVEFAEFIEFRQASLVLSVQPPYLLRLIKAQAKEIARLKIALSRLTDHEGSQAFSHTAETASVFHPVGTAKRAPQKTNAGAGLEMNYPEHSD